MLLILKIEAKTQLPLLDAAQTLHYDRVRTITIDPEDAKDFDDAISVEEKNGKTVVVYSWNKYCTTCAKQKPILLQAEKDFEDFLFLNYEQTKHENIAKFLNISYWSTIAIYKNNKQVSEAIGISNKDEIYSLIKKGI